MKTFAGKSLKLLFMLLVAATFTVATPTFAADGQKAEGPAATTKGDKAKAKAAVPKAKAKAKAKAKKTKKAKAAAKTKAKAAKKPDMTKGVLGAKKKEVEKKK